MQKDEFTIINTAIKKTTTIITQIINVIRSCKKNKKKNSCYSEFQDFSYHLSGRFSTHIWLPLERSWSEIADFFSTATYLTRSWTPTKAAAWKLWSEVDTVSLMHQLILILSQNNKQHTTFLYQALSPTSSHRLWSPSSEADGHFQQQQQHLRDNKHRFRGIIQNLNSQHTLFIACLPCPYISSASIWASGPVLSTCAKLQETKTFHYTVKWMNHTKSLLFNKQVHITRKVYSNIP